MTATDFVSACAAFVGATEGSSAHRAIIAAYNSIQPLPRRYPMTLTDPWCAAFLSAVAQITGFAFPSECGCYQMSEKFKAEGCWKREGSPAPGDIVFFSWNRNGVYDHVGIVEKVTGDQIATIEGNRNDAVRRMTYDAKDPRIIGYGIPKYDKTDISSVAVSVILGRWGNGAERKARLTAAGYDYDIVQAEVNRMIRG